MTKHKLSLATAEPPEGSPADWYARGYRDGIIHGCEQGIQEVVVFEHHARALSELAAGIAKEAKGLEWKLNYLVREMQRRYGEVSHQPDKWKPHPAYFTGVEMFERHFDKELSDQPRRDAETEPLQSSPKPKARKSRQEQRELGPSLSLDVTGAHAGEPELPFEEEARRAAGQAWRA